MTVTDALRQYLEQYHDFDDKGDPTRGPRVYEELIDEELVVPSGPLPLELRAELLDAQSAAYAGEPVYLWHA